MIQLFNTLTRRKEPINPLTPPVWYCMSIQGTTTRPAPTNAAQWVAGELRYELARDNVPMGDVVMYVAALDSVWMRDYGPIVMKDSPSG